MKTILDDIIDMDEDEILDLICKYENKNKISQKFYNIAKDEGSFAEFKKALALAIVLIDRPANNVYQIYLTSKKCSTKSLEIMTKYFDMGIDYDKSQEGLKQFGMYRAYLQKLADYDEIQQKQTHYKKFLKDNSNIAPLLNSKIINEIKSYEKDGMPLCFDISNWGKETDTFTMCEIDTAWNAKSVMFYLKHGIGFGFFTARDNQCVDGVKQIIDPTTNEIIFENKYITEKQSEFSLSELMYFVYGKKSFEILCDYEKSVIESRGDLEWKKKKYQRQKEMCK